MQLERMNDADLRAQTFLIADTFCCQKIAIQAGYREPEPEPEPVGRPSETDFVLEARRIAEQLSERAWIGPVFTSVGNRYRLDSLRDDLYAGRSGIALFLAALHYATNDERYRKQALAALARVSDARNIDRSIGIGGLTGLGSIVYALTNIGSFLGDESLRDLAIEYARAIDPDLIAADTKLDVVGGAAGAILGLVTLYSQRPESFLLDTAVRCAEHLMNNWTDSEPGFAHGCAGVEYSLARLSRLTGFRTKIRDFDQNPSAMSWCRGVPGIVSGQSRDIELDGRWLSTGAVDHLCCGNLGRGDILLRAGRKRAAEQVARQVLARKEKAGNYRLIAHSAQQVFVPGFFRGVAGIGYAFLRMARPDLPSILALE
jgi:lantibiotic modifying enzyme